MNKTRTLVFASAIAAAMGFGGVVGATVAAVAPLITASAASPSPSPSPGTFKSNETPSHEAGESAAQEAAENNGTFHPNGPGGAPGTHQSNESPAHEATESPSREAAEKS
jgi:hypothetical protein